jgi:crotonobetainyl-CoA:carnitine CoA-transferase CaiB-like acyl-CoA transferase
LMTAQAVLIALYMREKSGIGQEVEASLLGSMVYLLGTLVNFKLLSGVEFPKRARARVGNPIFNHYKCKDGNWIVLGCPQSDRYWSSVCSILGLEHLEKDPRFENMEVRGKNGAELVSILDDIFITKTRPEWLNVFGNTSKVLVEPVNTVSDVVKDPQVWSNDYIIESEHPVWGKVPMVGFPMHFSQASSSVRLPVPEFGQHTEEVLTNVLGYSWDDITRLKDKEVI